MRQSPSIIPGSVDHDVYLVEDDFGRKGRCWRETDVEDTDLDTVIADMLEGQFKNPVRVVGFNTAEGWSRDVSEDVAQELRQRCADQGRLLPESLEHFVHRNAGPDTQVQLPLPIRF
jgi:hypothetical protein